MTYKTTNGSEFELSQDCVLCNDVVFRDEYNPHHIRPWIIGNEYGPLVIVWASCDDDAFDIACDAGKLDGYAWIAEVVLTPRQERDFAEARGANVETLNEI